MKKVLIALLCLALLLPLAGCGEDEPVEVVFTEDMTLDALEAVLREKGDAMLLTDIPENYAYQFQSVGSIPQIIYPITETMSFCVMPAADGGNLLVLSVLAEDGETLDHVGAENILAYINALKENS